MDDIVARNLRKFREAAGYTQKQVGTALGLDRSAYANYESGIREVPYDVLEKVSDLFGCDMYVLFEENADAMILASAFRLEGLTPSDMDEIVHFKDIVKSYLKMEKIASR